MCCYLQLNTPVVYQINDSIIIISFETASLQLTAL